MIELPKVDVFAFDKTGTLTDGDMRVVNCTIESGDALPIISALVIGQKHPISRAIHAFVSEQLETSGKIAKVVELEKVQIEPGQGLRSTYNTYPLLGGSAYFVNANPSSTRGGGQFSEFYVSLGSRVIAHFELCDSIRAGSKELVEVLRSLGKEVMLISGDLDGPVRRAGAELAIESGNLHSTCSPSGKLEILKSLQATGKRVCFVGDGINDTPALGVANVSIAISDGTSAAQATADIIVNSRSSLKDPIITALKLANTCVNNIKLALGWSVVYNVFAVLLASGAFVNFRIPPKWAGLGEIISLSPVILIAISARWTWKRRSWSHGQLRRQ